MDKGIAVRLKGANVAETAKALAVRLVEMGRGVEVVDAPIVERFGGEKAAAFGCGLLARNGVVVIVTHPDLEPQGDCLEVEVGEHDTPDFAADKILDELAETGVVILEESDYSPEEEEQIRERLSGLGYIE